MLVAFVLSLLSALPDALIAVWLKLLGDGVLGHRPRLVLRRGDRPRRVGDGDLVPPHREHARCSGGSATRSRSRSSRTSRGCWRRSRRSRTTSAPTISIGCRCCATRSSCSITCTCRCSPPPGGSCASASRSRCSRRFIRRWCCSPLFALPTVLTSTWRPGVERAAQERGAQSSRLGRHLFTTGDDGAAGKGSARARHRQPAGDAAARGVGALVRSGRGSALGLRGVAHAGVGGVRRGVRRRDRVRRDPRLVARRATCCSCSPPARGCPRTSARRSARSDSCAASGWTARGGWRGSRTTRRRSPSTADRAGPRARCTTASASITCRSAYPGTSRVVLDDVSLTLPAGAVVAIVGENGAGKTTLVKLLAKMYEPTHGRDLRGRDAAGPHAGRRLARAPRRRVPGFLPLRVHRPPQRRPRRRAAHGRRAGGR